MTQAAVEITFEEGKLFVAGRRRKASHVMENAVHLPTEHVEKAGDWKPLHEEFAEAVNVVRHCTGKDETYLYVNCIHVASEVDKTPKTRSNCVARRWTRHLQADAGARSEAIRPSCPWASKSSPKPRAGYISATTPSW